MKASVKKALVAALRSGKYKQGRGRLRSRSNCFCVMGVLCNLHAQAHPEIAAKQIRITSYMGKATLPPKEVLEWADLPLKDLNGPILNIDGRRRTFTHHNDFGVSFSELADAIEKQL